MPLAVVGSPKRVLLAYVERQSKGDDEPNKWLERMAEAVTRRLRGGAAGGAPPCAAAQPHRWAELKGLTHITLSGII
jgi:hypothetical protein